MQCMESIFHKHIAFLHFLWILCFIICRYLHIFLQLHFCRYGYDGVGKDALSLDIFYHQECQRAYATHASLWWLLSIYLASYFIQMISEATNFLWNVQTFQFFSPPYFRATCDEKSFYEIPEMPRLQYKNANMSRSVEGKGELSQIIISCLFALSWEYLKKTQSLKLCPAAKRQSQQFK